MTDRPDGSKINGKSVHFNLELRIRTNPLTTVSASISHNFFSSLYLKSSSSTPYSIYCQPDHCTAMYRLNQVGDSSHTTTFTVSTHEFDITPAVTPAHVAVLIVASANTKLWTFSSNALSLALFCTLEWTDFEKQAFFRCGLEPCKP